MENWSPCWKGVMQSEIFEKMCTTVVEHNRKFFMSFVCMETGCE